MPMVKNEKGILQKSNFLGQVQCLRPPKNTGYKISSFSSDFLTSGPP